MEARKYVVRRSWLSWKLVQVGGGSHGSFPLNFNHNFHQNFGGCAPTSLYQEASMATTTSCHPAPDTDRHTRTSHGPTAMYPLESQLARNRTLTCNNTRVYYQTSPSIPPDTAR